MTLSEKLAAIQRELKAPKNLRNTFGGYNYRNAEGILEAYKPFSEKYSVCLVVSDMIQEVGGRVYVTATAILMDMESTATISATASAREQESKKGMDEAQITGAASSYARKYALNGLFCLDDTKDPDTDESRIESENRSKISGTKAKALQKLLVEKGVNIEKLLEMRGVKRLEDLTEEQHLQIVKQLERSK